MLRQTSEKKRKLKLSMKMDLHYYCVLFLSFFLSFCGGGGRQSTWDREREREWERATRGTLGAAVQCDALPRTHRIHAKTSVMQVKNTALSCTCAAAAAAAAVLSCVRIIITNCSRSHPPPQLATYLFTEEQNTCSYIYTATSSSSSSSSTRNCCRTWKPIHAVALGSCCFSF